jgi:hypothetical protein
MIDGRLHFLLTHHLLANSCLGFGIFEKIYFSRHRGIEKFPFSRKSVIIRNLATLKRDGKRRLRA